MIPYISVIFCEFHLSFTCIIHHRWNKVNALFQILYILWNFISSTFRHSSFLSTANPSAFAAIPSGTGMSYEIPAFVRQSRRPRAQVCVKAFSEVPEQLAVLQNKTTRWWTVLSTRNNSSADGSLGFTFRFNCRKALKQKWRRVRGTTPPKTLYFFYT